MADVCTEWSLACMQGTASFEKDRPQSAVDITITLNKRSGVLFTLCRLIHGCYQAFINVCMYSFNSCNHNQMVINRPHSRRYQGHETFPRDHVLYRDLKECQEGQYQAATTIPDGAYPDPNSRGSL